MASKGAYTCTLSKELQKKAADELNERPECRAKDIQFLREKVLANRALSCPTDDYSLLKFLRAAKFDYDKAYQRLLNYYTFRAKNWDIYTTMLPSKARDLDDGVATLLPSRDKDGRQIILMRFAKWNYHKYSIHDVHKTNLMCVETMLENEDATVNGFIWLCDFGGASMGMMAHIHPREQRLLAEMIQDAYPIRFKGCYCFNAPTIFELVYSIIRPFLKQKTRERVLFMKKLEHLQKHVDKSALPEDYGGTLPNSDILAQEWKQKLLSREDKFQALHRHKIVLDRKIGERHEEDIVKSVMGTFKKLDV